MNIIFNIILKICFNLLFIILFNIIFNILLKILKIIIFKIRYLSWKIYIYNKIIRIIDKNNQLLIYIFILKYDV